MTDGNRFYIGAKEGLYTTENKGAVQCLIPKVDVYRIFQDSSQELWVGCRTQGLYHINRNGQINRIPYDPSSPKGIPVNKYVNLLKISKGTSGSEPSTVYKNMIHTPKPTASSSKNNAREDSAILLYFRSIKIYKALSG